MLSTQGSVIGMVIPPYRTRSPALPHPSDNDGEDEAERLMPSESTCPVSLLLTFVKEDSL